MSGVSNDDEIDVPLDGIEADDSDPFEGIFEMDAMYPAPVGVRVPAHELEDVTIDDGALDPATARLHRRDRKTCWSADGKRRLK